MTNVYTPPSANVDDVQSGGGAITAPMLDALRGTKGWVLLIGILLFLGAAFCVLGGVGMVAGMGVLGAQKDAPPMGALMGIGVFYLIVAVIYIFLGLYLVQYSSAISQLLRDGRAEAMESALNHQRKFWRLAGVLALVSIVFMVVGILAAIAIPIMMKAS